MSVPISSRYAGLAPYVPGEQPKNMRNLIKLNTNESPFPPPEAVIEAAREAAGGLRLYNDTEARLLCEKYAAHLGVSPENLIATNGSDEILYFAYLCFGDESRAMAYPDISYGFYPVYADVCRLPGISVPLREDFTIDVSDYFDLRANVVFANPNAPTGVSLPRADIEALLRANTDRLVLVDEAYIDFGGESCVPLIGEYDNLLVARTFSKSFSLAGGRLGFGVACPELIAKLKTVKNAINPYNVNSMTQAAGAAAIDSIEYFRQKTAETIRIRDWTARALRALGFWVSRSDTNFVFFGRGPVPGKTLFNALRERGILTRRFDVPRIEEYIRMSMGTMEQMETVLGAISEIVRS